MEVVFFSKNKRAVCIYVKITRFVFLGKTFGHSFSDCIEFKYVFKLLFSKGYKRKLPRLLTKVFLCITFQNNAMFPLQVGLYL